MMTPSISLKSAVVAALDQLRRRGVVSPLPPLEPNEEAPIKPPTTVDNEAPHWVCRVCGNPNHMSRQFCFMQVCAAPRGFPGPYVTAVRELPPADQKQKKKAEAAERLAAQQRMAATARAGGVTANAMRVTMNIQHRGDARYDRSLAVPRVVVRAAHDQQPALLPASLHPAPPMPSYSVVQAVPSGIPSAQGGYFAGPGGVYFAMPYAALPAQPMNHAQPIPGGQQFVLQHAPYAPPLQHTSLPHHHAQFGPPTLVPHVPAPAAPLAAPYGVTYYGGPFLGTGADLAFVPR